MIMLTETGGASRSRILKIASGESLEATIAEIVRLKIVRTKNRATLDAKIAQLEKDQADSFADQDRKILELETQAREFCTANRGELFPDKKSRETQLADFGFEFTGWRVETAKKVTAAEAIKRLLRTAWGKVYVRTPSKQSLDKELLLKDREKLTAAQTDSAGIVFANDEQFYIRPKPETAKTEV